MSTSVPLSTLLTSDTPYEWHDAVAIVAQLLDQVRADIPHPADTHIPDVVGITLEGTGVLTLALRPGHTFPLMPGAAQLLQQLLSGREQPTLLRLFAMQAATADPPMPAEQFVQELARWERPNRAQKLVGLHGRATQHIGEVGLQVARQAQAALPAVIEEPPKTAPKRSGPSGMRGVLIVGAALLAGVGAGAVAWMITAQPATEVAQDAASAEPGAAPGADIELRGGSDTPADAARPAPVEPARAARRRRETQIAETQANALMGEARQLFDRQQYAEARLLFGRIIELLREYDSPLASELRDLASRMAEVARAAVMDAEAAAALEYKAGDPGVVEPVPLSILPAAPRRGADPSSLEVLEVHIDQAGAVESARLVVDQPSFRSRWMVSAAKTWRFKPATKDGAPVRFVKRIVLDDGGRPK
jgi:hypothetical protein